MRYFCVGDEDMVLGFKLAGVDGVAARTALEADNAFFEAVTSKDVAIIIIAEHLADMIRIKIDKFLASTTFPLVVEVPGYTGPGLQRKSIADIVRTAVGVKI